MDVTKKTRSETTVTIVLKDWEASDLQSMLVRISNQKTVGKSEFSLREKITGRKLLRSLQQSNHI